MRINGRLQKLESHPAARPQTNGRILWAYEYPDDTSWEAAKAEHRRRWPHHQGVRFIDDVSFRKALHGEQAAA